MSLADALAAALGRRVTVLRRVAGGDINEAYVAGLAGGGEAFVKTRGGAGAGEYAAEAAALRWLADAGGPPVPDVLAVGDDEPRFLALQLVEQGTPTPAAEEELGRAVARMHAAGAPAFGATAPGTPSPGGGPPPLRLGALTLPNDPLESWAGFYAERRLRPLLGPAVERGSLSPAGARAVERVCERMPELAGPDEPPARLHGDLWTGNVLWGADGRGWLVDAAAYGGHREIDLAMLRLFGRMGDGFSRGYAEVHPPADGAEERVGLWQLFPLLVHAVLFGGAYGQAVERTARRYAG